MDTMRLEQIGFYTLSDQRAETASSTSRLQRCELILTGHCNFKCPYCRSVGGPNLSFDAAVAVVRDWAAEGLRCIRLSGGEPTIWPPLSELVAFAKTRGIERIAVSTNGSMPSSLYDRLIDAGVNDFSVSLDACCAEDGDKMAGGIKGAWQKVTANIRYLSSRAYVTVGIVLTPDNVASIEGTVRLADSLGVSDIRVIPAAQCGGTLLELPVRKYLDKYPILRYRFDNIHKGRAVRGISATDSHRCGLVLDDMAVMGNQHYPCIIYMREGGKPIGLVGSTVRAERAAWYSRHDSHTDPICSHNCLDVCVDYNNTFERLNKIALHSPFGCSTSGTHGADVQR